MPRCSLRVTCDSTTWGENVAALGSWNGWDKNRLTILSTSPAEYPTWHATVSIPNDHSSNTFEYKYAIVSDNTIVRWESSSMENRTINLSKDSSSSDVFGSIPNSSSQRNRNSFGDAHIPDLSSAKKWNPAHHSGSAPPTYDGSLLDPLERALVRYNQDHKSWRQRLAFVRSLFTDSAVANAAEFDSTSLDSLTTLAVYINFLSTGQVRCAEDGGHHRPNHHANEARQIDAALAALVFDARRAPPRSRYAYLPCVARKIFPHLPSYSSQFTVSVPLTRIRDIAHRNDIPRDLKLDIKHNLQNKLHRCAGPEDLHTSARILQQISHGGYSQPFVDQFHIFHAELQAFFNASSLDDRLRYLAHNEHTSSIRSLANQLLSEKHNKAAADAQLDTLVALRQGIAALSFVEQPANPDSVPSEDVQKTRLADIDLENYAFILLAAEAKIVEESTANFPWPQALHALAQAMTTIAQSGVRPREATAAALELDANSALFATFSPGHIHFQRVRAAIDRALRFAHEFSSALTDVYERRVATLGTALGVERHAISVFAEAEIRSAITFQASRLADAAARAARSALKLPPWNPLCEGQACGELIFADELDRAPSGRGSDVIVVARHADGDEDVPTHVKGVILGRSIPHLSHLGVRARQAGVVFVCAEEQAAFAKVWEAGGRGVHELQVDSREGLSLVKRVTRDGKSATSPSVSFSGSTVKSVREIGGNEMAFDSSFRQVVLLERATKATSSAKAAFAGRLSQLAVESSDLFEAPNGVVVPHGVFQEQLENHFKKYSALVNAYNGSRASGDEEIAAAADAAYNFIRDNFVVEKRIVAGIQKAFSSGVRVMVRSSANAEDLEQMSGAGLYDSIANVIVSDTEALKAGIARVWASLWTRRAASSRASYDVKHSSVSMAVLVQEMVTAQLSFVAFSHDPVSTSTSNGARGSPPGDVYVEMAVGMGETLASASGDGNPYRLRIERKSLKVEVVSLASYGLALEPKASGGGEDDGLELAVVDYTSQRLTTDAVFRENIARRIARAVLLLEKQFGGPQDVEGAVVVQGSTSHLYVLQARPQIV